MARPRAPPRAPPLTVENYEEDSLSRKHLSLIKSTSTKVAKLEKTLQKQKQLHEQQMVDQRIEFEKEITKLKERQLKIEFEEQVQLQNTDIKAKDENSACHDSMVDVIYSATDRDDINEMTLECYFQGRDSGKDLPIKIKWIKLVEPGKYRIQFQSTDDVTAVLAQQEHFINAKKVEVCGVTPPANSAENCNLASDKLLIMNIPKNVNVEVLSTFIDGRLDPLEHEKDYTVMIKNRCALVTFTIQHSDKELNVFQELLCRKVKVQGHSVERCQQSCSITIINITNNNFANQDSLEIYFESPKSGGGEDLVESVMMLSANSAKITFKNSHVISSVLTKDHTKLGQNVRLAQCSPLDDLEHESLLIDDLMKRRRSVNVPVDPLIIQVLRKNPELLEDLSRKIQMTISLHSELDGVVLQPNESTPPGRGCSDHSYQFERLLPSIACKVKIETPHEIRGHVSNELRYIDSSQYEDITNYVTLAGTPDRIIKFQQIILDKWCRYTAQENSMKERERLSRLR